MKEEPIIRSSEEEYRQNFRKDSIAIISSGYGRFEIGIQNLDNNKTSINLCLATIEDFPASLGSNRAILDIILESLSEKRIDFNKFKNAVRETVDTLFDGKARVSFPNEQYIDYAIECIEDDSWGPAIMGGKDVIKGVGEIFGLSGFQLQDLLNELSKKNNKE